MKSWIQMNADGKGCRYFTSPDDMPPTNARERPTGRLCGSNQTGHNTSISSRGSVSSVRGRHSDRKPSATRETMLLESVLQEIQRLNTPVQRSKSGSDVEAAGDKLLFRLVELENENEVTTSALIQVIDTVNDLLASKPGSRPAKIGASGASAVRVLASTLLPRLETLGTCTRNVCGLLRERQNYESELVSLEDQRATLLQKNSELMDMNRRFQAELLAKDREIQELHATSQSQKQELSTCMMERTALENEQSRLAQQVQDKESAVRGMSAQVRVLMSENAHAKIDASHTNKSLRESLARAEEAKELLKKAARAQKIRANRLAAELQRVLNSQDRFTQYSDYLEDDQLEEYQSPLRFHTEDDSTSKGPFAPHPVSEIDRVTSETHNEYSSAEKRLQNLEVRLRTSEDRNRSMANQLGDTTAQFEGLRSDLKEALLARQQETSQLEALRSERDSLEDRLRTTRASREDDEIRSRVSELETEAARLRLELESQQSARASESRELEHLTLKLKRSQASQHHLEQHLQLLKTSYERCFPQNSFSTSWNCS